MTTPSADIPPGSSQTRGARKRSYLFQQGAASYNRVSPNKDRVYVCPLCLRGSADIGLFSLEHVPPESAGGKEILLTCTWCNNTDGSQVDVHIAHGIRAAKIEAGEESQAVRFTSSGKTVSAEARFISGILELQLDPTRSDPRSMQELMSELDRESAREGTLNASMKWIEPHNPARERIAWLRAGYLYAFAQFGYNYILRPEMEPIREQIKRPKETVLPELVGSLNPKQLPDGIFIISEPEECHSVIVVCGGRAIRLPGFEKTSTFLERIATIPEERWLGLRVSRGSELPVRPLYLFDALREPQAAGH